MEEELSPIFSKNGQKIYRPGEEGCKCPYEGNIQDFKALHDQCITDGVLFEDPEFKPYHASIYDEEFEIWQRPKQIVRVPLLFDNEFSRFDVEQGSLGDCWFVVSMSVLAGNKKLFFQVVPEDQNFDEDYAGIFHFRFWQNGQWLDIVIDDRLPTIHEKLVFTSSKKGNIFWGPLLEKAYAKLFGSFKKLEDGENMEALTSLTGGVTETYLLNNIPNKFYQILLQAYERGSLLCCGIFGIPSDEDALKESQTGLMTNHAYNITRVCYVKKYIADKEENVPLLCIRNPWGNNREWKGQWSDKSAEWNNLSYTERQKVGLVIDDDGEFWIHYEDFLLNFSNLTMCHWNYNQLNIDDEITHTKRAWELITYEGEWIKGQSAGGPRDNLETFCRNPQYTIELVDPDENDDEELCTVIIALMNKHKRLKQIDDFDIGFAVYKQGIDDPKPLNKTFFEKNSPISVHEKYPRNETEISQRLKLSPGRYYIIVMVKRADIEGEFLLRIFTEKACSSC